MARIEVSRNLSESARFERELCRKSQDRGATVAPRRRWVAAATAAGLALALFATGAWAEHSAGALSASAARQIQALQAEKASRTPAQQKIDSQLLYTLRIRRGEALAAAVPTLRPGVEVSRAGMTLVDIRATSTVELASFLRGIGASVVNRFEHDLRALVPLLRVEEIAARGDVRWVMPAAKFYLGKNDTSQGDTTHRAALARTVSGLTAAGMRVGVLSDSDDFITTIQGTGDLPPTIAAASAGPGVTEVPGQNGQPATGEGSGMMEIVFDLAPSAHLFFATADGGLSNFANNITTLAGAPYNCNVIVDDVTYYIETPFHEGDSGGASSTGAADVIQAVNTVVAGGVMYFSSAANDGNLDAGTSGTWEGDFAAGAASGSPLPTGGTLHRFQASPAQDYDVVTSVSYGKSGTDYYAYFNLWWADPLGGSNNDYDLYILDPTGTSVLASSTNGQSGSQDPQEHATYDAGTSPGANNLRLVVLQKSGAAGRFLHVGTNRSRLSIATNGATRGHNAIGGNSVAATPALAAFPNPFNNSDVVESFSSDGFRRVFFGTDGTTALTAGNFSSTGGAVLTSPDMTAADGVSTQWTAPGQFYGTSAAAPHAAAIAAVLKSGGYSNAQVLNAMKSTAIDIQAGGTDRDSGAGIVMALAAIEALDPCTFTCPNNITGPNTTDECGADVSFLVPVGSGACGTITPSIASGSFFSVGTTPVTLTAQSGQQCTFDVTVNDTQHPSISCPADIKMLAPNGVSVVVNYPAPTASDNCPGVVVNSVPPSGSTFPVGNTVVTATATDAHNNTSQCTFNVLVYPPIPTLSRSALVGLAILLLLLSVFVLRSRIGG